MQIKPANWEVLFSTSHKTEYKFVINGVDYMGGNISGTPTITKPLLDKPALGRVCTGSLSLTVLTECMAAIPKAAQVDAYCRLSAASGGVVTGWLPQGRYYAISRSGDTTVKLSCMDGMVKAGTTYRDKSVFTEWPQTMNAVVNEIASIMGVSVDSRTKIMMGADYKVSYPNDDMLISEVLGMIAAAHGGNWIMTETGKLRLIRFSGAGDIAQQIIGKTHSGYKTRGKSKKISRVILSDNAGNDFTAGDDTGATLGVQCDYATQSIASALCNNAGGYLTNGCLYLVNAEALNGSINLSYGTATNGQLMPADGSVLYGIVYEPYSVDGAYLDPTLELGDTISVSGRNNIPHKVILQSVKINCTSAYTCALSANVEEETEDEYPFISAAELSISRSVRTDQTYFGNRLTRAEGFVSELSINGEAKARMTANASLFSMQTCDGGTWVDRIYFDTQTGKYVITADVTINGAVTFNSLSTQGASIINGGNITTGVINADLITAGVLNASLITSGTLDCSTMTVSNLSASSITTGNLNASRISGGTLNCSTMTVSNLSADSITVGTLSASRISGGTLDCSYITVSNLNADSITSGTLNASKVTVTNLSASNITSGTLSADRIDTTSMHVQYVYAYNSNYYISIKSVGTSTLYVGGDGSWNFAYMYLYADNYIYVKKYSWSSDYDLAFDMENQTLRPNGTTDTRSWKLGTASYQFSAVYTRSLYISGSQFNPAKYSLTTHTHSEYSLTSHTHSGYASTSHTHSTINYDSVTYASMNYSKQFVPYSSSGYSLGNSSYPWQYAYITEIHFGGDSSYYIIANASRELRPSSTYTYYPCYLGTSNYPWQYAYLGSVQAQIGTETGSKIGFYGESPITRKSITTVSTTATVSVVATKLNELIGYLKNYGLLA